MLLNDRVYDVMKWVALIVLPASGTLYFALAGIWNLPYGEEVTATIIALNAFLGALLGFSTVKYNKTQAIEADELDEDIAG